MAIGKDGAVRRQLRTLFNVGTVRELTDGQLLERFATDRGEAAELAFAVLVERHGPMVMRVCLAVLGDSHDAQDAFQATFLVLVKRARGLWVRDSIGPWLHQVAYRTATCARTTAARHRRLERHAAMTAQESRPERDFELERLLHEEIDRLPERYRAPVVLCDLEGRTYEQAARHLGWPVGTIKSRLFRGRERLRHGLLRRGAATDVGVFIAGLGSKAPVFSIPPALLDTTAAAALRFATIGPAVRGSAASLAQGVLRTMSMTQWWKVATVLMVACATASGVEWPDQGGAPETQTPAAKQDKEVRTSDVLSREVRPGTLKAIVSARGYVEAARVENVYNRVEGQTTIIKIVREGQMVKKGDVVAELDAALLQNQLANQRVRTRSAEAGYRYAELARQVAELALHEYTDGGSKGDDEDLRQEVTGIRAAIRKGEGRLERTRAASKRLNDALAELGEAQTPADIVAELEIQDRLEGAELDLARDRRLLAQAERKRVSLREKTIKELEGPIKTARADERDKKAAWDAEKAREQKLEKQVPLCTLVAPMDGKILYANDPGRWAGRPSAIEEGATVRERQIIARVYNPKGPMQINAKVPESEVSRLAPGMTARVKVDAYPDVTLTGRITEIAPLPDPGSIFSQSIKVYTTRVLLDKLPVPLVPGFTATAEIVAGDMENVLSVPAGAVVHYGDTDHVAVKAPDGKVEWRDVVLGLSDGSNREVKEGLRAGEQVILDPKPFLSDEQQSRLKAERDAAARNAAARAARLKGRSIAQPDR